MKTEESSLAGLTPVDSDGDENPDVWRAEHAKDTDGNVKSYVDYDQDGKPVDALLADGRHLVLDENSKGIPGLQYKFLELHHNLTSDEAAVMATRAYAEGITADKLEAIRDYPIAGPDTTTLEVDESGNSTNPDCQSYAEHAAYYCVGSVQEDYSPL